MNNSDWVLTDWKLGLNSRNNSIDLERLIWPRSSLTNVRTFRREEAATWPIDSGRMTVLRALIIEIRSWNLAPVTTGVAANALRRFVQWVDLGGEVLSRDTVVLLLLKYDGDTADNLRFLRNAAAGLLLSVDERALLSIANTKVQKNCAWRLLWVIRGSRREADFARLLNAGDIALPISDWNRMREQRLIHADVSQPRRAFVESLLKEFNARATDGSLCPASLSTCWRMVCQWVLWNDSARFPLTADFVVEALQAYAQHLTTLWRGGRLRPSSVRQKVEFPLHLVAAVLGRAVYTIRMTISLPSAKSSGFTTAAPDVKAIQSFSANLSTLVREMSSARLLARLEAPINANLVSRSGERFEAELPGPYGGFSADIEPRVANLPLIQLRIWAELHRFIAVTGCNLSIALSLTIGQHSASEPVWKGRAGKFVSTRTGKAYGRILEEHKFFLATVFSEYIQEDSPLFPSIITNGTSPQDIAAKARGNRIHWKIQSFSNDHANRIVSWLKAIDVPVIGCRELRRSKANWLLRRYGGDSLQVARDLGNTAQVTMDHYGGKGNLEWATYEWSKLWTSDAQQFALAPGGCSSPGRFESIVSQGEVGGCNEVACLGCVRYRGEDSLDYIHRMLTFRRVLSLRASINHSVERPIAQIDLIIESYLTLHTEDRDSIRLLENSIDVNPHPRFAALLRLGEIMC